MKFKQLSTVALSCALLLSSIITTDAYNNVPKVEKIAGKDNYETAALIADKQKYSTAILVNLDNSIADGLSSSGLSGTVNAPILLTKKDNIPEVTMTRINNANKIYIIGGVNSVSSSVENNLKSKGLEVIRIQGKDRIDTSLNVANEIKKYSNSKYIFYTNGFKGEADAISIAPIAARYKAAIIQTDGIKTPYKSNAKQKYVIGGKASMSETLVKSTGSFRIGGKDRFETNRFIVDGIDDGFEIEFYGFYHEWEDGMDRDYVTYICDGDNLVPGLVASPLAKWDPLYLVSQTRPALILDDEEIRSIGDIDINKNINYYGDYQDYGKFISNYEAEQKALENCVKRSLGKITKNDLIINYSELETEYFPLPVYDVRIDNKKDKGATFGHFFVNPLTGKVYENILYNTYWY